MTTCETCVHLVFAKVHGATFHCEQYDEAISDETKPSCDRYERLACYREPDEEDTNDELVKKAYVSIAAEIGRLVGEKQLAYGNSFGRSGGVMRILYPNGIRPEQYDDALGVVRVVDKLFRIANRRDAFGESPWRDIGGYGILGAERCERGDK